MLDLYAEGSNGSLICFALQIDPETVWHGEKDLDELRVELGSAA